MLRNVPSSEQHHVVTVDEFQFFDIAECGFDVAGGLPGDTAGFLRAVIDQPARDLCTLEVNTSDDRTALEVTLDVTYANGKQTFPSRTQCLCGAIINGEPAGDLQMIGKPLLACRQR